MPCFRHSSAGPCSKLTAINSDQACVIAGTPQAIAAFDAMLKSEGIETRLLSIHVPFHTKAVEPHLDAFRTRIADIRPCKLAVPM